MSDLTTVHKQQRQMMQLLERLQSENSALWRELTAEQQRQMHTTETLQKVMVCWFRALSSFFANANCVPLFLRSTF